MGVGNRRRHELRTQQQRTSTFDDGANNIASRSSSTLVQELEAWGQRIQELWYIAGTSTCRCSACVSLGFSGGSVSTGVLSRCAERILWKRGSLRLSGRCAQFCDVISANRGGKAFRKLPRSLHYSNIFSRIFASNRRTPLQTSCHPSSC